MGVIEISTNNGTYFLMASKIISFHKSDESDYETEIEVEGSEDLYITTNSCEYIKAELEKL